MIISFLFHLSLVTPVTKIFHLSLFCHFIALVTTVTTVTSTIQFLAFVIYLSLVTTVTTVTSQRIGLYTRFSSSFYIVTSVTCHFLPFLNQFIPSISSLSQILSRTVSLTQPCFLSLFSIDTNADTTLTSSHSPPFITTYCHTTHNSTACFIDQV
jgi:hypothetical protein